MDPDQQKSSSEDTSKNPAVDLIRQKLSRVYNSEPNAKAEISEVEDIHKRSKHQQFMYELSTSGKSLAEIQTSWHNYYIGLPDDEKHKVWREFYAANKSKSSYPFRDNNPQPANKVETHSDQADKRIYPEHHNSRNHHRQKINVEHRLSKHRHFQSLLFGVGFGCLVILVLLFGFFNERFIAPFITPSRTVSSTPIIVDPNSVSSGPEPKIIIPKINVELPVIFDEKSIDEKAVDSALEKGVIHYATTSYPGELGNGAIFGHSSNNILNKGQFKFAFVLLKRLETGDTFMIQYNSKRYVYKVYDKKIVRPDEVSVLNNTDKPATFTLITCDPPGTSLNRLVVWGEQISPDPGKNIASSAVKNNNSPSVLPSNAPTLWQKFWSWFNG